LGLLMFGVVDSVGIGRDACGPGAGKLEVVDSVGVAGGTRGPGTGRLGIADRIGVGGGMRSLERAGLRLSIASAGVRAALEWAALGRRFCRHAVSRVGLKKKNIP